MTDSGGADISLRGKTLHPEMARRVMERYRNGHYEDAVLAAFKVIENRLRDIIGQADADLTDVLKEAFHPATGTLQDPQAWQSEREGLYLLFKSAFLSFRNRRAHVFVDTDEEEAFDLIVLANRMLLMAEKGARRSRPQQATTHKDLFNLMWFWNAPIMYGIDEYASKPVALDADNDGKPEVLIPSHEEGEVIKIFKDVEGAKQPTEVEKVEPNFPANDIQLVDVDNDGQQEIICISYGAYHTALLFYKYQNGRYEVLKKDPRINPREGTHTPWFFNARVADINDDGQVEVVSEPRDIGYRPAPFRYVWKWNESERLFQLLYTENMAT